MRVRTVADGVEFSGATFEDVARALWQGARTGGEQKTLRAYMEAVAARASMLSEGAVRVRAWPPEAWLADLVKAKVLEVVDEPVD